MDNRNKQFVAIYEKHRHIDQIDYYQGRQKEYKKAQRQVINITGILLVLTTAAPLLAVADVFNWKAGWAVLSVVFPALSAALMTYGEVFAFNRQATLFQDAVNALKSARADVFDLKRKSSQSDDPKDVASYVNQIEDIFKKEQGQWGQLISSIKQVETPEKKPDDKK